MHSAVRARSSVIGALVGMGPASTAPFYNAVMEQARLQVGARRDDEFPEMVLISLPTPFVPGAPLDDALFTPLLTGALQRLEGAGATFAAVACNVVHRYMPQMRASTSMEVLDAVALTAREVARQHLARPALLATGVTVTSHLYQEACARERLSVFWEPALQAAVDALIVAVKRGDAAASLRAVTIFDGKICRPQDARHAARRVHDLRRTFVSLARSEGARVDDLWAAVGHRGHVFDCSLDAALRGVGEASHVAEALAALYRDDRATARAVLLRVLTHLDVALGG